MCTYMQEAEVEGFEEIEATRAHAARSLRAEAEANNASPAVKHFLQVRMIFYKQM